MSVLSVTIKHSSKGLIMKSKDAVFQSHVLSYERLTPENDSKHTYHIEMAWNKDLPYQVGDSVAICPVNRHEWIEALLPRLISNENRHNLIEILLKQVNLKQIPGKLVRALLPLVSSEKISILKKCLDEPSALKEFNDQFEAWQLLEALDISIPSEVFIPNLMPLHPRFYSIASSYQDSPNKIALTIAHVHYTVPVVTFDKNTLLVSKEKNQSRYGVCSDFLFRSHMQPSQTFEAWIHPAREFFLAPPEKDILMIGPGTGVAPFRAFMIERLHQKSLGSHLGRSWLFFGERYAHSFFYEELWKKCQKTIDFEVTCAFSRETSSKFYVQDALWKENERVYEFLKKGVIYICGDAKHMAKDVEICLMNILQTQENIGPQEAKDYIKRLRQEKRLMRDVY